MRYSQEFLLEKYKTLPQNLRNAIGTINMDILLKDILDKNKLHLDNEDIIEDEICNVMFGAEKATDFKRNLKIQLRLPDEKINAIAKDVYEKCFLPMMDALFFERQA